MKTKSLKIKAAALSLAALTAFGAVAPYAGAQRSEAHTVSSFGIPGMDDSFNDFINKSREIIENGTNGGSNTVNSDAEAKNAASLDDYLKAIAPKNKKTLLVDKGTGTGVVANSEVKEGSNKDFYIIRRTKESVSDMTADLGTLGANINGIYPGAVVHADSGLVDGHPTVLSGSDLKRKPVTVGIDINGNTQEPITVENPTQMKVMAAINKQVQNWLNTGNTAAANMSYKSAMAYDSKQLDTQLGVKDAADKYGIDIKANIAAERKDMLVCFNQIYYTARVSQETANDLFDESVTPETLAKHGVTKENPGVAEVTSMDFGRQIVVKLSSDNVTREVEAAWKASVGNAGIENKNKYKDVMENTTFSVYAYGGSTSPAGQLITTTHDIAEVNKIIAGDIDFKKGSAAAVMSYGTHFIDDNSQAYVTRATEYVKTTVEKRDQIHLKTDPATAYATKHQKFYGRPIIGVNEDGSYKLGPWEKLLDEKTGNKERYFNGKYAEFGFSFDISWGTDWPYSDVFWTVDKGAAKEIKIEWGGGVRTAWIEITVDGTKVVDDTNCSSHSEYNFGC